MSVLVSSENMVGLRAYLTTTRGIGGRLRSRFEDFVVEEVLWDGSVTRVGKGLDRRPGEDATGKFCWFVLEKRGLDIYQAIRLLSKRLGVSHRRFSYCGSKDARAVTAQLVSVFGVDPEQLVFCSRRLKVLTPYRAARPLRLGDHWGNSFKIRVTDVKLGSEEVGETLSEWESQVAEFGGVPNFFGHQRFGVVRSNTHMVGRAIIKGDFEQAVHQYLCTRFVGEDGQASKARRHLARTGDFKKALQEFPKKLVYERTLLSHLASNPRDFVGALRKLPRNLLSLFVRAYQAYLFNVLLSNRIASQGLPSPRSGDVMEAKGGLVQVGLDVDTDRAREMWEKGEAIIMYPVLGFRSGTGPIPPEAKDLLESEGLTPSSFYIRQLPDISPQGGYRRVMCPVYELRVGNPEKSKGGVSLNISFRLLKACYATVVLRELMKADITAY